MSIKKQLCNIVKELKHDYSLTYDSILKLGRGGYHRSQLVSVLKHDGANVSVDVISDIINAMGGTIEIHLRNRLTLQEVSNRLEAL